MNKILTQNEINKIQELCFSAPAKACAVAQIIVNTCQVVSCSTFAKIKSKPVRTVQYQSNKSIGIDIDGRKYLSINQ